MILILFYQFKYGILVIKIILIFNFLLLTIAGAERYRAITTSHIRNADGAFLVYDITSSSSFESLDFWQDCIKKATNDDIVLHLIGNKCDLKNRAVPKDKAQFYANRNNFSGFSECSAKDNIRIKETFESFYRSKNNKINRTF